MERERVETQLLERTFQEIKKITGMSNIKQIVEKVTNKDKDYNLCVAKVSDRETKLNIIKEKIKKLAKKSSLKKKERK
jgi:predicted patatin/cPLA2 family phospholipase